MIDTTGLAIAVAFGVLGVLVLIATAIGLGWTALAKMANIGEGGEQKPLNRFEANKVEQRVLFGKTHSGAIEYADVIGIDEKAKRARMIVTFTDGGTEEVYVDNVQPRGYLNQVRNILGLACDFEVLDDEHKENHLHEQTALRLQNATLRERVKEMSDTEDKRLEKQMDTVRMIKSKVNPHSPQYFPKTGRRPFMDRFGGSGSDETIDEGG